MPRILDKFTRRAKPIQTTGNPDNQCQRPDKWSSTVVTGKRVGSNVWEDIYRTSLDKLCRVMIQYDHFITQDYSGRTQI